jgi:hypothetical protein
MCYKILKKSAREKLALALPLPILFESRRKKLQRFLSLPILDVEKLWFPIINSWLAQNFTFNQVLYLAIDRTSWARINLMMVRIISFTVEYNDRRKRVKRDQISGGSMN